MKVACTVMLVGTDGHMPPMGTTGTIVADADRDGDYEVMFPKYPWRRHHSGCCPDETDTWFVPGRWLMPLDDLGVALLVWVEGLPE